MKKISVLLFLAFMVIWSCKKKISTSTGFEPDCSGTTPTYAATVGPLIASKCATSECHASGSSSGPGALTSYTQVKNAAANIRASVLNGSMPKNSTLTSAEKNNIICWIDAGAINN